MTELINHIYADSEVWKQIGNAYVVDPLPPGIQSNPERLLRLRAYGYACMLHVVLLRSLPVPMSTVFAYAILQPDGDAEALKAMRFLRASAPNEVETVQYWPTKPADFLVRKDDERLKALTIEYFNKLVCVYFKSLPAISDSWQPEMLALLPADTLRGYAANFYHQVLFGCATPFSDSPDIQAFAAGFNGRIGEFSSMTLATVCALSSYLQ